MEFIKNNKSSFVLLGSMLIGALIGAFMGEKALILEPVADLFLNLLYCCVVPMIFISLVSSIASMENLRKLGKLLIVMMLVFLVTQLFASAFMGIVCSIFDPAKGSTIVMNETIDNLQKSNNFLAMLTVNDFVLLWSRKNLMALIVFAMFTGVALVSLGEKVQNIRKLFNEGTELIMKMIKYVMYLAPIGLGAYFAILVGQYGNELSGSLARAFILYLIVALIYYFFSNALFAFIGGGFEGVKRYFEYCIPPTLTALGTSSSAASIPVTTVAAEKMGISPEVRNLCVPLGANLHKDGACLTTMLKITFMCSIFNIDFLEPKTFLTAVVVSTLASMVMGAIPAGGYVGEIFIISAFAFPPASIPIMVLLGTITDAPTTAINVTGDISCAMIVEKMVNGKSWLAAKN